MRTIKETRVNEITKSSYPHSRSRDFGARFPLSSLYACRSVSAFNFGQSGIKTPLLNCSEIANDAEMSRETRL